MIRFLRTTSTARLLALVGLAVVLAGAGAVIATAASGGSLVPPPKPLARAVRDALAAPAPAGISARVRFTNHLLWSGQVAGSSPLLSGASGRLWATSRALRVELQGDNGDAQLVATPRAAWFYDGTSNALYRLRGAERLWRAWHGGQAADADRGRVPTLTRVRRALARLERQMDVSGAQPTDVGGRPAYEATLRPAAHGGLLRAVQVAWDARYGLPLRLAVYSRSDSSPVLELRATDVSYGRVPASVFAISPPPGAKTTWVALPLGGGGQGAEAPGHDRGAGRVTGLAAVRPKVSFGLAAPAALLGRPRGEVRLLPDRRGAGAAVLYGRGLDTIVVLEQPASAAGLLPTARHHEGATGLDLPSVDVGGTRAQQLSTPLGTVLRWQRGGVTYTLLGSVRSEAADAAARQLGG